MQVGSEHNLAARSTRRPGRQAASSRFGVCVTARLPRCLGWIIAAAVSAGLSACASSGASPPKQPAFRVVNGATYIPVATAKREYANEAATLQLPAALGWPRDPLAATESGQPEWYEIGYARQAADRYWFCSWSSVATKASDRKMRGTAVDTLQHMLKLYYYTNALDGPSRPQLVRELSTAKRGDLTALRNDLRLNC